MPTTDISSDDLQAIAETMGAGSQEAANAPVEAQAVQATEAAATVVTPAQPEQVPAPEVPEAPATPVEQFNLLSAAKQVGLEVGENANPEDVQRRLIAGIQQLQEERARIAREAEEARIRAEAYEISNRRQAEQQVVASKAQPTQPAARKPWEPPPFNEQLVRAYWQPVRDAEGKVVIDGETGEPQYNFVPHTPPEVLSQVHEYRRWKTQWEETVQNPAEMMKLIREQAREEAETAYAARMEEFHTRQAAEQQRVQAETYVQTEIEKHQESLFEKDPFTNKVNRQRLTPLGQQMHSQIQTLMNEGLPAHRAWEYASRYVGLQALTPSPQAASPQQAQAEAIRKNFRQATKNNLANAPVNHNPQAGGTLAVQPFQPATRDPDLGAMIQAEFGSFFGN